MADLPAFDDSVCDCDDCLNGVDREFYCGDPGCSCGDDEPEGWPGPGAWVVTETGFAERGLL